MTLFGFLRMVTNIDFNWKKIQYWVVLTIDNVEHCHSSSKPIQIPCKLQFKLLLWVDAFHGICFEMSFEFLYLVIRSLKAKTRLIHYIWKKVNAIDKGALITPFSIAITVVHDCLFFSGDIPKWFNILSYAHVWIQYKLFIRLFY